MRDGKPAHTEAKTFDREQAAKTWMLRREAALSQPGAIEALARTDPTLSEAIDLYLADTKREPGKTKSQVLRSIKRMPIGAMKCSAITSADVVNFAKSLTGQPQTVGNYIAHLASIFAVARPAWNVPLDMQAMNDARVVMKRLGVTSRSKQRTRRPTLDELDMLLEYFGHTRTKRINSNPMQSIVAFAILSTRRLDEITRITWADLDEKRSEILVRDMKNPGEKIGNNVRCSLVPEALRIIKAQPRVSERIFPANADSISSAFTRACQILGIEDLHFHDLRHDGISRLFELGWTIPQAAAVSGHRTWTSLKRYTHMREEGDKYAGWKWLDVVGQPSNVVRLRA
jgi:integrase